MMIDVFKLFEVLQCPNAQKELHRRDQSSAAWITTCNSELLKSHLDHMFSSLLSLNKTDRQYEHLIGSEA